MPPDKDLDCSQQPFCWADMLLILPFIWQLALAPMANTVSWRPMGLPFAMAWQLAGIGFATAVIALRYCLERRS